MVGSDEAAFGAFVLRVAARAVEAGLPEGESEWGRQVAEGGVGYGGCCGTGENE